MVLSIGVVARGGKEIIFESVDDVAVIVDCNSNSVDFVLSIFEYLLRRVDYAFWWFVSYYTR